MTSAIGDPAQGEKPVVKRVAVSALLNRENLSRILSAVAVQMSEGETGRNSNWVRADTGSVP